MAKDVNGVWRSWINSCHVKDGGTNTLCSNLVAGQEGNSNQATCEAVSDGGDPANACVFVATHGTVCNSNCEEINAYGEYEYLGSEYGLQANGVDRVCINKYTYHLYPSGYQRSQPEICRIKGPLGSSEDYGPTAGHASGVSGVCTGLGSGGLTGAQLSCQSDYATKQHSTAETISTLITAHCLGECSSNHPADGYCASPPPDDSVYLNYLDTYQYDFCTTKQTTNMNSTTLGGEWCQDDGDNLNIGTSRHSSISIPSNHQGLYGKGQKYCAGECKNSNTCYAFSVWNNDCHLFTYVTGELIKYPHVQHVLPISSASKCYIQHTFTKPNGDTTDISADCNTAPVAAP